MSVFSQFRLSLKRFHDFEIATRQVSAGQAEDIKNSAAQLAKDFAEVAQSRLRQTPDGVRLGPRKRKGMIGQLRLIERAQDHERFFGGPALTNQHAKNEKMLKKTQSTIGTGGLMQAFFSLDIAVRNYVPLKGAGSPRKSLPPDISVSELRAQLRRLVHIPTTGSLPDARRHRSQAVALLRKMQLEIFQDLRRFPAEFVDGSKNEADHKRRLNEVIADIRLLQETEIVLHKAKGQVRTQKRKLADQALQALNGNSTVGELKRVLELVIDSGSGSGSGI